MAIDYTGHCRFSPAEAQKRIVHLRSLRPDWFKAPQRPPGLIGRLFGPREWLQGVLLLTDASDPAPFGAEIAAGFGISARSHFLMSVIDKERLDEAREAVELVYEVFGTEDLVITYGNDSVRPPLQSYPGVELPA
jgi:hypothetical protein